MSAVTASSTPSGVERYRAAFAARWQRGDTPGDPLAALRLAALERFAAAGLPTQRHEDWKYTNLRRLEARTFAPAERTAIALDTAQDQWIAHAGTRIVLVNGHWMPGLSSMGAQPPGATVLTLGQWLQHDAAGVAELLAQNDQPAAAFARRAPAHTASPRAESSCAAASAGLAAGPAEASALEQLNLAFFEDGVVVNLADECRLDEPVYIVHQWNDNAALRMSHPRVIVQAGRGSRCTLIEHFLGPPLEPSGVEYFTNAVTTLDIAAGAAVRHYRLQQESPRGFHIGHVHARQQADSRYSCHDIALGAGLGRVGITAALEGPGAHVALQGLFAPGGTQHLDSHTRIEHIAPHTTSEEDYRGVAAARGRGVFNGKVIVHAGAQHTDARQSSRNLLLSPGAEIDTKPELEIYANEVKCSHGATTGQLDAAALFYLRSRGLPEAEARSLLIRAFAESILSTIDHAPLRAWLEQRLDERFAVPGDVQT